MADLATPSGAAMFDGGEPEKKTFVKPERPDEATYKEALTKAEKAHAEAQDKFKAMKAKLDSADQSKNKDTPSAKRRQELLAQLKEIREKQAGGKAGRSKTFENIKKYDDELKSLIAAQKATRSRNPYKNVEELDREINRLDKQVETGTMKMVDEKKALAEISSLRKQRKNFAGYDEEQKKIDLKKKQLVDERATLDDPEAKALSEKYNKLQAEMDVLKAEQDDVFKNFKSLRDEKEKLNKIQQEKWTALKDIKDNFYNANRAAQQYEFEARKKLRERKKAENEAFDKEKKKERAQKMLAEASDKAYLDEIRRAESLVRFLDPSFKKENAPLQAPSQFSATAQRKVDDSGLKGFKVVKKVDEEDYFKGTGGKKGKKGKKGAAGEATTPAAGKYSCPPSVMEDCASMGIEPPMGAAEIPSVLEKVKAKLTHWREDQDAQTQRNIEKAKKEVERLDAEDEKPTNVTPAPVNGHGHGETKATASVDEGGSVKNEIELIKGAVSDVADDLKGASIEDKAE